MAMDKAEREYVDVSATDFSEQVQLLLLAEREAYNILKAAKAATLAVIKVEVPMPQGKEIASMAYTRWGQLQLVVQPLAQDKVGASKRPSLAQFIAAQNGSGASV